MIAIGKTIDGKIIELKVSGTKSIFCNNNNLTELIIPEGIRVIFCYNNNLTELVLPEGVRKVYCDNNKLTELILPESIEFISCDKNIIDLTKDYGNTRIRIYYVKSQI